MQFATGLIGAAEIGIRLIRDGEIHRWISVGGV